MACNAQLHLQHMPDTKLDTLKAPPQTQDSVQKQSSLLISLLLRKDLLLLDSMYCSAVGASVNPWL